MRREKQNFIERQCKNIEDNAINNSTKDLCTGVKNLAKAFKPTADTVKSENRTIPCDGDKVWERWEEYCYKLYGKKSDLGPSHLEDPTFELEPPSLLGEIEEVIKDLKTDKSPGVYEIISELIKSEGPNIAAHYQKLRCKS